MKLCLIPLALSILIIACSYEPAKPSNVPAEAFWIGGHDGGVFLRCKQVSKKSKNYQCSVYNDFNGEVWKQCIFTVENGSPDFNPDDKEIYAGYDGSIILRDYRQPKFYYAFVK